MNEVHCKYLYPFSTHGNIESAAPSLYLCGQPLETVNTLYIS